MQARVNFQGGTSGRLKVCLENEGLSATMMHELSGIRGIQRLNKRLKKAFLCVGAIVFEVATKKVIDCLYKYIIN